MEPHVSDDVPPTAASPSCLVCRCYEIGLDAVERALADGALSLNDVKRRTKVGMGLCQGAYCMPVVARLLAEHTGQPLAFVGPMTARPPARPIPLETLADLTKSARGRVEEPSSRRVEK
jgi:bacterioferritin-associated ferredoxin